MMKMLAFTLFTISLVAPIFAISSIKLDTLPEFSDSIVSKLEWCDYSKVIFKLNADTLVISQFSRKKGGDTLVHCDYILPFQNIRFVQTRVYDQNSYELSFFSMSDQRGFFTECQLPEFRTFSIPMLDFHTSLNDSMFFKSIAEKLNPYLVEYQPDCSFIDREYISMDTFLEGTQDYKLIVKSSVNSNENKDSIVVDLLKKNFPEWAVIPRFRYLFIQMLVNKEDSIVYYSLANYGMYCEYKKYNPNIEINDNKHIHDEPRGGFITEFENQQIEQLIRSQKWEAGMCDDKKVDTIFQLILSLN